MNPGGVDYVTKPFDPDLLLLKVKTFQRLYEQNRTLNLIHNVLQDEIESRKKAQKALEQVNLLLEEKVLERTQDLLDANKELEINNAELQQYASVASHDLQEPLRKIITYSRIIHERYLPDNVEARQYLEKVISSSERMRTLIYDLLNYSKLSIDSQFSLSNLNDILKDSINDLELSIEEKGAKLIVEEMPEIEVIPGQIRQVFQNIISNALKFSKKEEPPVIRIWAEPFYEKNTAHSNSNGDYLNIYIQDNGIGFNELYLDKMFTLFQRLHRKDEYGGTGIGLAIVKKIIEKHNGRITAKGKENEGSTFIIVLPTKQIDSLKTIPHGLTS